MLVGSSACLCPPGTALPREELCDAQLCSKVSPGTFTCRFSAGSALFSHRGRCDLQSVLSVSCWEFPFELLLPCYAGVNICKGANVADVR